MTDWKTQMDKWLEEKKPLIELEESERLYVGPETKDKLMALFDEMAMALANQQTEAARRLALTAHDVVIHGYCSGRKDSCYCTPCVRERKLR
jgi:hypothetical protein